MLLNETAQVNPRQGEEKHVQDVHPFNNHLEGKTKPSGRIKHSEETQPNEVRSSEAELYKVL